MYRFKIAAFMLAAMLCLSLSARSRADDIWDWHFEGKYTLDNANSLIDISDNPLPAFYALGQNVPKVDAKTNGSGQYVYVNGTYIVVFDWQGSGDPSADIGLYYSSHITGSASAPGRRYSIAQFDGLNQNCPYPASFDLTNQGNAVIPIAGKSDGVTSYSFGFAVTVRAYHDSCTTHAETHMSDFQHG